MEIKRLFNGVIYFFFAIKDIWDIFKKAIDFVKNLETTDKVRGGGSCSLRHYDALRSGIDMWFTPKS